MIREAAISDFDDIYRLLVLMHGESRYRVFDIDHDKHKEFARAMILDSNKMTLVAEKEGDVVGVLMAAIGEMFFSKCIGATDRIIYVNPSFRKKGVGGRLVDKYIRLAKDKGAIDIMLSTSTGISSAAIASISKSHDMEKVGESYRVSYVR